MSERLKHNFEVAARYMFRVVLAIIAGIIIGAVGSLFSYSVSYVTAFRKSHSLIIWLLPLGGLVIAFLYEKAGDRVSGGTNRVIRSISGTDQLPFILAPLIFVSTVITHLFGGSSGREGAALQLGGSLAQSAARKLKLSQGEIKIMTMCGMSAAFSALFGTPLAAAFFSMELTNVGVMYYSALLPCVASALSASMTAKAFGIAPDAFVIKIVQELTPITISHTFLLAFLCGLLAIVFCVVMHEAGHLYEKYIPNPYLRVAAGGLIVAVLTFLVGSQIYNGAGLDVVELAIEGEAPLWAFLMKILFTALTLGAGYKGGEIVPSLYIGATFGALYAALFGLTPGPCVAIAMCALFCGVTNCPVSSLLLSFELFGYDGMPYFLIACAVSYGFSGYYSLYSAQKFMGAKEDFGETVSQAEGHTIYGNSRTSGEHHP